MAVLIKRGADKSFIIKLRIESGDPYQDLPSATLITVKFKKSDGTILEATSEQTAATNATATLTVGTSTVTFTAAKAGESGNSISLTFNGTSDTLESITTAWNVANPANQVSHNGTGTDIPTAVTVKLNAGIDAYIKAAAQAPTAIGFIKVTLSDSDTNTLRLGRRQSVDVVIDKGVYPQGFRDIIEIPNAIDVLA